MARTKAEVRAFLNSQVGKSVNAKAGIYQGQCVSLIKALLEFLGAPDPYAARGHAKDAGDTLVRQGIAANKPGWLNVCVNRSMGNIGGVTYGHIWLDLSGEANYEQNGARALYTTKNTRPRSQAQQIVNLDKYIKKEDNKVMVTITGLAVIYRFLLGWPPSDHGKKNYLGKVTFDEAYKRVKASNAFKKKVAEAKKNKTVDLQQLPAGVRQALGLK